MSDKAEDSVVIAHISDLHVARRPQLRDVTLKRLSGFVNYSINRRFRHDESHIAKGIKTLAARKPDLVLATGDLVQAGLESEFVAVEELFQPLRELDIPIIAVDGNHDIYGRSSMPYWEKFKKRLALPLVPDSHGIIRYKTVELLPLDQGVQSPPFFSYGRVDHQDLAATSREWREPPAGVVRLVCGHYPVVSAKKKPSVFFYGLTGWKDLWDFLRQVHASAYFCGHYHKRFHSDLGGGVVQYVAASYSVTGKADLYECRNGILCLAGKC